MCGIDKGEMRIIRTQYQLLKDNEPIAVGSMTHCLDVFYWEIYYGYDHLTYNIVPFSQDDNELQEIYKKAKDFDEVIKKVKTEFVSQDLADDIRTLVYDYEYDKEDE